MTRCSGMGLLFGVLAMASLEADAAPGWTRFGKGQGLPDEAVRSLCFDAGGRLWAGTVDGGLAVLDGQRFSGFRPDLLGTPHVRSLALNARGELWAATDAGAARIADGAADWMPAGTPGLASAD